MNKTTIESLQDILNDIDLNIERVETLNDLIQLTTDELEDVEHQNKIYSLVYANNLILKETDKKMNQITHKLLSIKQER